MIRKFLKNTFKKIIYEIFKIFYGKILESIKFDEDNRIQLENVKLDDNLNYKLYFVKESRLYTDRIHDTAIIIDKKIIDGPSFQLRKNLANSKINENIVFEKGTPRVLRKLNGSVMSLLTGGGGNSNYWHWLFDVLPRLKICEKFKKLDSINYFLFPSLEQNFQKETLRLLGFPEKKLLSSKNYRHIKADEIIVSDHPYMLTNNPHSDAQKIPIWIINWLKEKFLNKKSKLKTAYSKKIYIDRTDSKSNIAHLRTLKNENEVRALLLEKGFDIVKLSELNFNNQVKLFNDAECIVGLHGSGFANLPFCEPQTKVVEFRNFTSGPIIENIAKKINLNYNSIISENKDTRFGIQQGHIHVPIEQLANLIN